MKIFFKKDYFSWRFLYIVIQAFIIQIELKDPKKHIRYSLDSLLFNKNYYNYCPSLAFINSNKYFKKRFFKKKHFSRNYTRHANFTIFLSNRFSPFARVYRSRSNKVGQNMYSIRLKFQNAWGTVNFFKF